jgi:hypothetical protein
MVNPELLIKREQDLIQLDLLYRLQNLMNAYVIKNYQLVGKADQAKIVTYSNPNLYKIAVQFYGDANYWTVIRDANGLTDFKLVGTFSLLIPPAPTAIPPGY